MASVLGEDDIQFVRELAREAGCQASAMRGNVCVYDKSGPTDQVTDADLALSKLLVKELSSRFQDDLIISEEDSDHPESVGHKRVWLIDPIDGTDNYIKGTSEYSVMIGLLVDKKPCFGCVYQPETGTIYWGGPEFGSWRELKDEKKAPLSNDGSVDPEQSIKLMMGSRDRRRHPWIEELEQVEIVKFGSIGLKVAKILEMHADLFVHLSGKLKAWDTAGPLAIALGGGLEAGSLNCDEIEFPLPSIHHTDAIIMGRPGSLSWCRQHLASQD